MGAPYLSSHASLFKWSGDGDPAIEAMRGWAAMMVVANHFAYMLTPDAGAWAFASTGVDLFFVLSGYVFAPYLFGRNLSALPHLVRRFFRLYPLYFCALLLYAVLRLPAPNAWEHFGIHLVMGHTSSSLDVANFYNPAFWSLPPEVEYYLLLPLLAWAVARSGFALMLLLAVAMHLLLVLASAPDDGITVRAIATVHIPGLLVEFMLGTLAYAMVKRNAAGRARLLRLCLGLSVLTGMGLLFVGHVAQAQALASVPRAWIGGNIGLGAATGYALVVSAVANPLRQAGGRFTPLFALAGQLSYGVYLFHNAAPPILSRIIAPMSGTTAVLLCIGITLTLAAATHYAIERPLRNYGRRLSQYLRS